MSSIADTAPSVASPVAAGAPQRSPLPPDGQWRPGVRRTAVAAGLAGRVPQRGTDLPDRLLAELAGLPVDDPRRARLRARVIEWHLPMTVYLARRFGGRGELLDDLAQVAAVGLIMAVVGFDPVRGSSSPATRFPRSWGRSSGTSATRPGRYGFRAGCRS